MIIERLTMGAIANRISGEVYFNAYEAFMQASEQDLSLADAQELKLVTICILVLDNKFTVVGKAFCIDIAHFDEAMGKTAARDDAIRQVFDLEAYQRKQNRQQAYNKA